MSAAALTSRPAPPRRRALGALRHRNYRLFLGGQLVSTIGTWMQSLAQPWLVLQLTHSAFLVGLVLALQYLPVLGLAPIGGLIADRFPKRRVLQLTQAAFMVPALFLFIVSWTGVVTYWMVLLAALAWGLVQLVDVPTRQAFAVEMVGREDLMNAIALNSSVWNAAAVIGPALAGVVIAFLGVPICFLINAVSYLAVIGGLALMRNLPTLLPDLARQPLQQRMMEGARYVRRDPVVGAMLIVVGVFSLFAMNRLTLMPLFAEDVLHVGAVGFGLLMGSLGLGSLMGALTLALVAPQPSGRRQFWVGVCWALALLGFSFSRLLALSMALLFVAGFCQMWFLATANTRIQTATPDRLRGRVMAFYAQAVMGVAPLGATQAGALASFVGAPAAMAVGAAIAGLVIVGIRVAWPSVFTLEPSELVA
jgi:MFS family permease